MNGFVEFRLECNGKVTSFRLTEDKLRSTPDSQILDLNVWAAARTLLSSVRKDIGIPDPGQKEESRAH